jgi:hypothetical protein
MSTILTGIFLTLIGWGNLYTGRKHPERINARLLRGMGYVGIVVGMILTIVGVMAKLKPPQ